MSRKQEKTKQRSRAPQAEEINKRRRIQIKRKRRTGTAVKENKSFKLEG
jgi:hypothetical protein